MASTFSPTLRLELIGDGDQSGIWGQTTNNNLGALIEQAITGVVNIGMPDSNYTMTNFNGVADEARNAVLVLTGTLTAQRNLIAPLVEKTYIIKNSTTGGFGVQIIGSSGTGVVIPNGQTTSVYCDGTNFYSLNTGSADNFSVSGNLAVTGTTTLTGALAGTTGVFSGAISGTTITGTNHIGPGTGLTGTAANFTAGRISVALNSDGTNYNVPFLSGNSVLYNGSLAFNPANGYLQATRFVGSGAGLTGYADSFSVSFATTAATASSASSATFATTAGNANTVGGFTPVQQSGGSGMLSNKIYIGWSGSNLLAQVDGTALGYLITNNNISSQSVGFATSAGSATIAAGVTVTNSTTNTNFNVGFLSSNNVLYNSNFAFNPATGILQAPQFVGSGAGLTGTASNLTAGIASVADATDSTKRYYFAPGSFVGGGGYGMVNPDARIGSWFVGTGNLTVYIDNDQYGITTTISDEKVKKNITSSTYDALATVNKIKFKEFDFDEEKSFKQGHVKCGITAQQVQSIDPDLVEQLGDFLSPKIDEMLYIALKAIQELEAKIDALEAKLVK
jgi:hypothetical protein